MCYKRRMNSSEAEIRRIDLVTSTLGAVAPVGKEIAPRSNPECRSCRRKVDAIGRLLFPGHPLCTRPGCEFLRAADVTEVFRTRYGRCLEVFTLRSFCRCVDGPSVFVGREEVLLRARALGTALVDLEAWASAFHAWSVVHASESSGSGRTPMIPPRRIDEVVRIRLRGEWDRVDPTETLPEPVRSQIRGIREAGPTEEAVPF